MSTPKEPRKEQSTYIVQDRSSAEEMNRLRIQDHMTTVGMGGLLPEQSNPDRFLRILDVACGTGNWSIQVAQTYPDISLVGIDISKLMIDYAHEQATTQGLSERVKFHVMDALRMLEFPTASFDLVNLRFGVSFLRTWDWPKMLAELQRVTKSGGIVRITEGQFVHESSSPAFIRWVEMLQNAFFQAGHLFEPKPDGLTSHFAPLLTRHGLQEVQTQPYTITYRAGTIEGQMYYEDWTRGFRTIRPFIQKWGGISNDYDAVCQQAEKEMQQNDFYALHHLVTAWGHTS